MCDPKGPELLMPSYTSLFIQPSADILPSCKIRTTDTQASEVHQLYDIEWTCMLTLQSPRGPMQFTRMLSECHQPLKKRCLSVMR